MKHTPSFLCVFLIVSLVLTFFTPLVHIDFVPSVKANPSWLSGWDKRVKFTVDYNDVDSALSNFPVLIYLNTSSGRNNDDVSFVFDELASDANRKKIAVTTSDETTECYVEIERWDDANEDAWLWFKAPSISNTTDTDFYLYYDSDHADNTAYVDDTGTGNSINVWDSNFKAVYHMRDNNTSTILDSTTNSNDGTKRLADNPLEATGKLDKAQDFEVDNSDYVTCGSATNLKFTSQVTLECWFKLESLGISQSPVGRWDTSGNDRCYALAISSDNEVLFYSTDDGTWNVGHRNHARHTTAVTTGTWYHYVGRYSSNAPKVFKDGTDVTTVTYDNAINIHAGTTTLELGRQLTSGSGQRFTDGILDEIRVSNTARSNEWIKADHQNQIDDFLDFGSEEERNSISQSKPDNDSTETQWLVNFNFTVTYMDTPKNASVQIFNSSDNSLITTVWNTSSLLNASSNNQVSYTFSVEQNYKWHTQYFNTSGNPWLSDTNWTLTVDVPPRYQNAGSNSTSILEDETILLYAQGYDGIALHEASLWTNETGGTGKNYTRGYGENFTKISSWEYPDGGWAQGIVTNQTHVWVSNNYILFLYWKNGTQIANHTGANLDGTNMDQINGLELNGTYLYVSSHTNAGDSYVKQFNKNTLAYVSEHHVDISDYRSEGICLAHGYWWITYIDDYVARYTPSWSHVDTYELTFDNPSTNNKYQSGEFINYYFYANQHKSHENPDITTDDYCDVYYWTGTGFEEIDRIPNSDRPDSYCSQELYPDPDGTTMWWAGRNGGTNRWAINSTISYTALAAYDSPMDMNDVADSWAWSNFTWCNTSIASGTTIQWRIYYNDTYGNVNGTGIHSFTVGAGEYYYVVNNTSDEDESADKGTHSDFEDEKVCDGTFDTLTEEWINPPAPALNETFEGSWLPTGWTEDPANSAWDKDDSEANNGTYSAGYEYIADMVAGNITSGDIDTSMFSNLGVQLYFYDDNCDADEITLQFYNSTGNWVTIKELCSSLEDTWTLYSISIAEAQYLHANFKIRLYGVALGVTERFYVDDVWFCNLIFSDGFELNNFDKWDGNGATTWVIGTTGSGGYDPNTGTYDAWCDGTHNGNLTSDDINLLGEESVWIACSILKDDIEATPDFDLYFYNGSDYNFIVDLNTLGADDVWIGYGAWLDSQYLVSNFRIQFRATPEATQENVYVDDVSIMVKTTANYGLDLEEQWINCNYIRANEELCIKTGTFSGSEDIQVKVWNETGSSWHWIMNLTASQWNNISVSTYLTAGTFTVQYLGGTETDDTTQNTWDIDCALLHTWGIAGEAYFIDLTQSSSSVWSTITQTVFNNVLTQSVSNSLNVLDRWNAINDLSQTLTTTWTVLLQSMFNVNPSQAVASSWQTMIQSTFNVVTNLSNTFTWLVDVIHTVGAQQYIIDLTQALVSTWNVLTKTDFILNFSQPFSTVWNVLASWNTVTTLSQPFQTTWAVLTQTTFNLVTSISNVFTWLVSIVHTVGAQFYTVDLTQALTTSWLVLTETIFSLDLTQAVSTLWMVLISWDTTTNISQSLTTTWTVLSVTTFHIVETLSSTFSWLVDAVQYIGAQQYIIDLTQALTTSWTILTQWNTATLISQSLSAVWTVLTCWNGITNLSQTFSTTWNVLIHSTFNPATSLSATFSWLVDVTHFIGAQQYIIDLSQTISASWNVLTSSSFIVNLSQSFSAVWNILTQWNLNVDVAQALVTTWNVLVQTSFNITSSLSNTFTWIVDIVYTYAGINYIIDLTQSINTAWNILTSWNINVNLTQSLVTVWTVLTSWNTNISVSQALTTTWTVLIQSTFDIVTSLSNTFTWIVDVYHWVFTGFEYIIDLSLQITTSWIINVAIIPIEISVPTIGIAVIALAIALSALVFALKKGKDKYEEEE